MATKSQRPNRREVALSSLNAAIVAVNLAKELSSVTPAKAVFGTVGVILTMIKVSFLLVCVERLQNEMHLGHDDQSGGLRRAWAGMCWCLYRPQPGTGGEEFRRSQRLCD